MLLGNPVLSNFQISGLKRRIVVPNRFGNVLACSLHGRACFMPSSNMAGFTFIGLIIIIAILGVVLMSVGEVWHIAVKREKERELLFVGNQFRQAIQSYKLHSPGSVQQQKYPESLEDLLKDPRFPSTQRYLRKIYIDPITGSAEWGIITGSSGGIVGVHSLSDGTPMKQSDFKLRDKNFEGKSKYSEWTFVASAIIPTSTVAPH